MKRKLSLILVILLCISALTVLTSCDFVLDLIFGTKTPPDNTDNNEPPTHTHNMSEEVFTGETCVGQSEITYYKCSVCNKCYLDEAGTEEIADVSQLNKGHLYVIVITETEHYSACKLCNTEQEGSRAQHSSQHWWYNPDNHYKICDLCGAKFNIGKHDETGSCTVCGRQEKYEEICNGNYGYEHLATFEHGADMQKLYKRIDDIVKPAHNNANVNAAYNDEVHDYVIGKVDLIDCLISMDEAYATVAIYEYDNPLYYWLDKQCTVSYYTDAPNRATAVIMRVEDEYANGAVRVEQNKTIYTEIDKYLSIISNENDPYYIALGLHDTIIDNVDYANKSDGTAEDASWAHSIVGVFDKKSTLTNSNAAVCEGYAKAYQLLLNACDVSNVYVTGSSQGVGHAWNLVQLKDKNWYYFDLTWDDQPNRVGGKIYDYFCKNESEFNLDHTPTASDIADGINYLYTLPVVATEDYNTDGFEIDENFNYQSFSFRVVGYNRLSVAKCLLYATDDDVATIPASVEKDGRTYKVVQIDNEAFARYTTTSNGMPLITSPTIVKLIIPQTVEVIYCKSFYDCDTLVSVEFADCEGWQRYGLTGQAPVYQQLSSGDLSNPTKACSLLKEVYKQSLLSSSYSYVWIKTVN